MREELSKEGQILSLPDGRQIGYLIVGEGTPVLHFHGGLSSRSIVVSELTTMLISLHTKDIYIRQILEDLKQILEDLKKDREAKT